MTLTGLAALISITGCSWFGARRPPPPDPTELIVTGAPLGSIIIVDGIKAGSTPSQDTHPQIVRVAPGEHQVEIQLGEPVVYREQTYVRLGEQRIIKVLSGLR